MRVALGGVGLLVVVAACGGDAVTNDRVRADSTRAPLIAEPESYTGADLGTKELVLTFDDGPGEMDVTGALAEWLHSRPTPIQATFFINGACVQQTPLSSGSKNESCGSPTPDADLVLAKIVAQGHTIGNHTTTHRDLVSQVLENDGAAGVLAELGETDGLIAKYMSYTRSFFRAPYGSYDQGVFDALKNTSMSHYVGPIYWWEGGGPTNANRAADWECWDLNLTTKACGDRYLKEIAALGNKGIVLMHDAKGNTANHNLTSGKGNTADMVKYIVPLLEADGFTFKRLDEVPAIAAALPTCDASCSECKGPAATDCTACADGKHIDNGACIDDPPPVDAGADAGTDDVGMDAGTDAGAPPEGVDASTGVVPPSPDASMSDVPPPSAAPDASVVAAPAAAAKTPDGCNASGRSGNALTGLFGVVAFGTLLRRRGRRLTPRASGTCAPLSRSGCTSSTCNQDA